MISLDSRVIWDQTRAARARSAPPRSVVELRGPGSRSSARGARLMIGLMMIDVNALAKIAKSEPQLAFDYPRAPRAPSVFQSLSEFYPLRVNDDPRARGCSQS